MLSFDDIYGLFTLRVNLSPLVNENPFNGLAEQNCRL